MSGESVSYLVTKPFKYHGKQYKPGDSWEPDGGNFDNQMIENQSHIRTVDQNVETRRSRMTGNKYAAEIVKLRERKNPMTYRKIGKKFNIHYSTASRIYEREKARKSNGKPKRSRGSSKNN